MFILYVQCSYPLNAAWLLFLLLKEWICCNICCKLWCVCWEIICHVGPTCYTAEATFPPLSQPKLVLDLATPEGCKAELTWIVYSPENVYLSQNIGVTLDKKWGYHICFPPSLCSLFPVPCLFPYPFFLHNDKSI